MLGGTVFVLDEGQLLQTGSTLDVYQNPNSERVAKIFSDPPMNLLPATIQQGTLHIADNLTTDTPAHMHSLSAGSYKMGVRPSHLTLSPPSSGAASETTIAIPTQVELAEITGSETFLHVYDSSNNIVAQLPGVHSYDRGETIRLYINPARLYAFDETGQSMASPMSNQAKEAQGETA